MSHFTVITPTSAQLNRASRARARLVLDHPFFGVLALHLKLKDDPTCETAWTDGTTLAFSPKYVDSLTTDELLAVMAHEVMHCACGHPWRRENRDAQRWNVAADYAINTILRDSGFVLPANVLISQDFAGKSAEWIYDRLPEGQSQPQGSDIGDVKDAPTQETETDGNGQPKPDMSEASWKQATTQAKQMARAQGALPGGIARDIETATKQPADWRALLRRYVQEVVRADYSWTRPNPRYVAHGLYLPALHSTACGPIAVAVDTSGSIDSILLAQFAKEIEAIASEVQPAHVDIVYCDSAVNDSERFERGEAIALHACGGGGTDFRPAFDHVDNLDVPPAVMIYLTDLMGTFPEASPAYPVIWAAYGDTIATYGDSFMPDFGDVVPCD